MGTQNARFVSPPSRRPRRPAGLAATLVVAAAGTARLLAQQPVVFDTADGGRIHGDLYGAGSHGVVLAHGGRFDKGSWAEQASALAARGFSVLALDFRGYGRSQGPGQADPLSAPLHHDVLAAVRYLRASGAAEVSVVGGSMGGGAAAAAAVAAEPGTIDRLVMLASDVVREPEKITCSKLFIVARDDAAASGTPRLVRIRQLFERAPEPKELVVLEGRAHAQYLFETEQAERLLSEIVRFLSLPAAGR